jgi:hypothetical protein
MRLVVLESHEGERTDVNGRFDAVGPADWQSEVKRFGCVLIGTYVQTYFGGVERRRFELEAVAVTFDCHISREGVATIRPPKSSAPVIVEWEVLAREWLAGA